MQRYNADMELEDAVHTSLLTLREGFEGEVRVCVFLCGFLRYIGISAPHPLTRIVLCWLWAADDGKEH